MPLYCNTAELPAVCAGTAKMKKIEMETLRLACELEPKIKAIAEDGQITLEVKHGWVASIGSFVRSFRNKFKTVD